MMLGLGFALVGEKLDWSPAALLAGRSGHWSNLDLGPVGRIFQDEAATIAVDTAGQSVGRVRCAAGAENAVQAAALSKPIFARHPKTGRRNLLNQSECALSGMAWQASGALCTDLNLNIYGKYRGTRIVSQGFEWHRLQVHNENILGGALAGQTYTLPALVKRGSSARLRCVVRNDTTTHESNISLNFDTSAVSIVSTAAGVVSNASTEALGNDLWLLRYSVTLNANGILKVGLGPNSTTIGEDVIGLAMQVELGQGTAWQDVKSSHDVAEAGVPDRWHLYNDGADSLSVALPAGACRLFTIGVNGTVNSIDVHSDGSTPINILRHERQLDAFLRLGVLNSAEETALRDYWTRRYA